MRYSERLPRVEALVEIVDGAGKVVAAKRDQCVITSAGLRPDIGFEIKADNDIMVAGYRVNGGTIFWFEPRSGDIPIHAGDTLHINPSGVIADVIDDVELGE